MGNILYPIEILNALTMVPGIFSAIYYYKKTTNKNIKVATILSILICCCSIYYHLHFAYYNFSAKHLRYDIITQQICIYLTYILARGISGVLPILPLITPVILANFNNEKEQKIALFLHAISIALLGLNINITIALLWFFTFLLYSLRYKYRYIISLAHLLFHPISYYTWSHW